MLELEGLNQYYGESHTIWDFNLAVEPGSCTCLLGRNGAGKTTVLKCAMGLLPAKSGRIRFEGKKISGKPSELRAKLGIGYVPQGRDIFPQLTVEENLRLAFGINRAEGKELPPSVFDLFPVLKDMLKRRGGDLSGGQQQQLAIARALMINPRMLILDESTEGVQPNIVEHIGEVIRYINRERGVTVLMVTLKVDFAVSIADRFYLMDSGRNIANGPIDELSEESISEYLTV